MKKVKRMMFGGAAKAAKAASNAAKNAAAKAPTPPPMQKAALDRMLAGLPKGSTVAGPGTGLGKQLMTQSAMQSAQAPTAGTRPMGTGTPQIPPQNINPVRPQTPAPAPQPGQRARPPSAPAPVKAPPPPQQPTGRGGIFGSRGTPSPAPAAPVKSGLGSILAGEGRSMANRMALDKKYMKKGGSVSSASKRADGCATKGKTKGKMV
jgi:hypothetical protein